MTTARLTLQLDTQTPPKELIIEGKHGWRLLARNKAIELKPLVDYDGEAVAELPVFDRATISPVPPGPAKTKGQGKKQRAANSRTSFRDAISILPLTLRFRGQDLQDLLRRIGYRAEFWHGGNSLGIYLV